MCSFGPYRFDCGPKRLGEESHVSEHGPKIFEGQ